MIDEIITQYERFSDALISKFSYMPSQEGRTLEVVVKCMNSQKGYEWETITLTFNHVVYLKFCEREKASSTLVYSALLKKEQDIITVDFFR